ncbi:MAG TPA: pyrroloquinoline quinone biosynthesis protein PqqB [Gammaproteobacteria bacterium]|nr:pyrroloquinoline quinone biosynthesis protein PqqB [Gammaproteobacteria bacterium]
MKAIVIGSAAGGGFPQWNCNARGSRLARAGDALERTQSSVAVSADGERWVLLNASPDLRQQINLTPALHPRRELRHSPIEAVLLTNADVDHVAGLLSMRESTAFALYGSARVLSVLQANSIFNVLSPELVPRREIRLGETMPLAGPDGDDLGLEIEAFAVPGKVALYLEDPGAGNDFGTREGDTVGVHVRQKGATQGLYYMPGCAELSPALRERLAGAPVVMFDGTLWRDDEMIEAGVGVKTGRRMGHMSMSGEHGTIAAFRDLDVGRRIFVHINNTNPVLLDGSQERREAEAAGWEIGYDGLEVTL